MCVNHLCNEEEGEKQLDLKPERLSLKVVVIILYHCIFLLRIHLLVHKIYKHFMKISLVRQIKEQVKRRNNHMEITSDSLSTILEVREVVRNSNATLQRDSFLQVLIFFNKMASVAESIMTFVMLHNTDTKCE